MKKSETGRSILELIFVLGVMTLILLAVVFLWNEKKSEIKTHAVSERLIAIKNSRQLSMQAHSDKRMLRTEKGPHNTAFTVENGINQQNSDWFWVTIETKDTSLCAFLNETEVGADKIDDFCEINGTTTFYFKKNPQKTTANEPNKNLQPLECPTNSVCDNDLNIVGCKENYFLHNFICIPCPENSTECAGNTFKCLTGYYKKYNTCQPCDESIPECNSTGNNSSSGGSSSGGSSSGSISSSSNPCKNIDCGRHGTCQKGVCICSDNYYGELCQTAPWNCQNGGTWNTTTHQCDCVNGYTGTTCATLDVCYNINCGSHGECSDGKCTCMDNYYGDKCENAPLTCQNGGTWNSATHKCNCPTGYSGSTCTIKDPCLGVSCGSHGTCSGGTCVCRNNYYGDKCQTAPLTCQNGGTWNSTTHQCDCATGFTGDTCANDVYSTCTTATCCTNAGGTWYKNDYKDYVCVPPGRSGACGDEDCILCPENETAMCPTSGDCICIPSNKKGTCSEGNCIICDKNEEPICSKNSACICVPSTAKSWTCGNASCISCNTGTAHCPLYPSGLSSEEVKLPTAGCICAPDGLSWACNKDFGRCIYCETGKLAVCNEDYTCSCEIDLCAGVNCGDHGTCSEGVCTCTDNYYGENCENAPLTCLNGGRWNSTTLTCDCAQGYAGTTCQSKCEDLDFTTCTTAAGCYAVQWTQGTNKACYSSLTSAQTACSPYTLNSEPDSNGIYFCLNNTQSGGDGSCTSYEDCNEGEYCQFSPNNCESDPTSGTCKPVSDCGLYDIDIGDGKKYTASDYSGSCKPDWWTAKDICASMGMRMVSLSDVDCEKYKWDFCSTTGTVYGALIDNGLQYGFWTTDVVDDSCGALCVHYGKSDYVDSYGRPANYAFLCITNDPCAGFEPTICTTACTNNNGTAVYTYAEEGTTCDLYLNSTSACDGQGNCNDCSVLWEGGTSAFACSYSKVDVSLETNITGCCCLKGTEWDGAHCIISGGHTGGLIN